MKCWKVSCANGTTIVVEAHSVSVTDAGALVFSNITDNEVCPVKIIAPDVWTTVDRHNPS